jgi:hypothetical protein
LPYEARKLFFVTISYHWLKPGFDTMLSLKLLTALFQRAL